MKEIVCEECGAEGTYPEEGDTDAERDAASIMCSGGDYICNDLEACGERVQAQEQRAAREQGRPMSLVEFVMFGPRL